MKNIKDFKLYLESLNSNEISGLSEVISLINENITYNGWYERLEELSK